MANNSTYFKDYKPNAGQSDKFASFVVFIFWPLLGAIYSFRHYKFKSSANIIWLFTVFTGMTFGFSEGSDSTRYADNLVELHSRTNYSFSEFWEYLIGESSGSIDIVQPVINFLVSRVTDNGYILFGFYGLIFGYFYSRNVWFLIDKVKGIIKIEALSFLILFAFLVPIWSINGFRFWTATHIFFFGLSRYFNGEKKGLLFILAALLVHFTYIIGVFLFLIYLIFGNRLKFYFVIYILSTFLSVLNVTAVGNFIENLPFAKVKDRTAGYINEEHAESYFEDISRANWYIKYRYDFMDILVAGSFYWIFFARRKLIMQNPMMLNFFCVGLVFMSFGNVVSAVPSMGRFYYIGYMAVTVMLFLFFQLLKFKRRPDWYKFSSIFFVSVFCLVEIRMGLQNLTIATIIGNPFTMALFDRSITLLQFINGVR